jgi:hypothetical protein
MMDMSYELVSASVADQAADDICKTQSIIYDMNTLVVLCTQLRMHAVSMASALAHICAESTSRPVPRIASCVVAFPEL